MEWKEVRLGDVISFASGGTPSKQKSDYWNGNIPWVSAKAMYVDFISSSDLFITDLGLANGSKLAPVGTILLLTRGSGLFNTIPICKVVSPVAFNQDVKCLFSKDENVLNNDFLFYWLLGNKKLISGILETTGIGAGKIDTTRFLSLSMNLPSLTEQLRLVKIASSIIEKIELNNKINAQLEEMAQALFKSWFVDFEPFKDGKFVESELGMIPEGWRVGTLGEIASITKKSINPQKCPDIVYNHYSLPAYDERRYPVLQNGAEIMSNKTVFEGKTTLVSKLNPHIKRVWFVNQVKENPICSTEFIPIKANNDSYCSFVHCMINSDWFYNKALSSVNGATTSHQRIHPEDITTIKFAMQNEIVLEFCDKVYPFLCKIESNIEESLHLSHLRDTLLPKLMNGEIEL